MMADELVIYEAFCPMCGINTRFQIGQEYVCCACGVDYVITPPLPVVEETPA